MVLSARKEHADVASTHLPCFLAPSTLHVLHRFLFCKRGEGLPCALWAQWEMPGLGVGPRLQKPTVAFSLGF